MVVRQRSGGIVTSEQTYTVVVGVDGSPSSKNALRCAIWHADQNEGRIVAVRAWDVPGLYAWDVPGPEQFAQQTSMALEETINEVTSQPPVQISHDVIQGQPVEALLNAAENVNADLLVVGNRGHGGFAGALLGSVSQQVVHYARCPVATMREKSHNTR